MVCPSSKPRFPCRNAASILHHVSPPARETSQPVPQRIVDVSPFFIRGAGDAAVVYFGPTTGSRMEVVSPL